MKAFILFFFLFSLISTITFAQKSMTFKEATELGIFQKLDSLYQGGIDSDSTKSLFKDQQAYMQAYQQFIYDLANFLSKNNFKWEKQVRCFNKIYFSKTGTVDYFLFNFKEGQITAEQEQKFAKLLSEFIKTAQFKLPTQTQFAQCSPIKYSDV